MVLVEELTPILSSVVVSLLGRLRSTLLDPRRVWTQPSQLHPYPSCLPSQRVPLRRKSRSRFLSCHGSFFLPSSPFLLLPNATSNLSFLSSRSQIWSTNYQRLISQTIFTLFYGGRDFAPRCIIDGVNIQEYLQTHYNQAMYLLALKIKDAGGLLEDCVIGWDSMNEPSEGLIGYTDIGSIPKTQALK